MFLPVLLCSTLLASPQFAVSGTETLLNEYSQPLAYQLDVRLPASRSREVTGCVGTVTGLPLAEPVTDNIVAETAGVNLTYLADHNHLVLTATDYTEASADRARATGQELKACLELLPFHTN